MSSPWRKNIWLSENQKSWLSHAVPSHKKGRIAIVTTRGAGCDGHDGGFDEARRCVRSSRVVLSPRRWGQVAQRDLRQRRWLTSPRHRGERGAAAKTIVQGMPDRSGQPVVTMLVWFSSFPREAAGAASARHSLRPLFSEGHVDASPGGITAAAMQTLVNATSGG